MEAPFTDLTVPQPVEQSLASEQRTATVHSPEHWPRRFSAGALVIAVLVGIQLGTIPWRYRRQIWQLQGFLLGAAVGYVVGRFSRESRGEGRSPAGSTPTLPPPPQP